MDGNDIIKRYEAMDSYAIGNWMNLWQECADWAWPTNDNVNRIRVGGQEKPPQRYIDTCIEANHNFASGFFSHMFPPHTVWAKFRHPKPRMMAHRAVADYFEEVSRIIHTILVGSNFAQEQFQALLAMGCFGTNCLAVEEDDKNIVKFRNYLVSNVRCEQNYLGQVDIVAREFELTPRQAVQQFGADVLVEKGLDRIVNDAANGKDTKYQFIHYVAPREDFDPAKLDNKNKPYASFYVSREQSVTVRESGFEISPYKVGRFTTGNDEVYGRSPMTMKLAAARRTNVIYRSMIVSAEQHANPQWLKPDDDSVKGLSSRAGAVITWRASSGEAGKPQRLAPNGDPGISLDMYKLHDDEIKRMFFNHLFRPLEDLKNMTATEVNERMTADLMSLAPFVFRYTDEMVTPTMEHVYYLCQKADVLPEIPAELAEDPEFEIDYVGRLSLATKNFEVAGAMQTTRMFMELGGGDPRAMAALDNVDYDEMLIQSWHANSSSMNALKDPMVVQKERDARAQAAQRQSMMDNMPAAADAAQKLSGAVDPTSIVAQAGG